MNTKERVLENHTLRLAKIVQGRKRKRGSITKSPKRKLGVQVQTLVVMTSLMGTAGNITKRGRNTGGKAKETEKKTRVKGG